MTTTGGHARLTAEKAARGLTPARRRALAWLANHQHTTLKECALALGIERSAVHYHRVSLAALGLIERSTDARGARLTPAGWAALGRSPTCPICQRPFNTGATS